MNTLFPMFGQLAIIAGMTWTACVAANQLHRMPHNFYYILVNRIRYLRSIGFKNYIKWRMPWSKFHPEYNPYNESYIWLMDNKIYINYALFLIATLAIIYTETCQFGTGEIFRKPKEFFIESPIRSITMAYIIGFLVDELIRFKRENFSVRQENLLLKNLLSDHHKNSSKVK